MNLSGLGRMFSSDLAVDLGTANTRLYVRGQGVVLDEPSVVAVDGSGAVQAVGNAAKEMLGRAPGTVEVVRPLRHGVIADFDRTQKMFRYFINKTRRSWSFVQPRLVIVTPSGITQVERRAVRDAARQAGAREPLRRNLAAASHVVHQRLAVNRRREGQAQMSIIHRRFGVVEADVIGAGLSADDVFLAHGRVRFHAFNFFQGHLNGVHRAGHILGKLLLRVEETEDHFINLRLRNRVSPRPEGVLHQRDALVVRPFLQRVGAGALVVHHIGEVDRHGR